MNYLPNKLSKLRKHYNYSQEFIADLMKVDVIEYMGFENGRTMINYEQAKILCSLYHISLTEMFNNTDNVTLYEIDEAPTDQINIEYFVPKKTLKDKIKEHPFLFSGILGLIVVIIIICITSIIFNKNYTTYVDNTDKLSVSETSLIYIGNNGSVRGAGDNTNGQISNLPSERAIKVSEGLNFSIILMDDGTVLSFGLIDAYKNEINKWKNIIDISAGENHVIACDNTGKTYSVGDNSYGQCVVNGFENIKEVHATKHGSIGLALDGKIYYAGDFIGTSTLKKYENIKDIEASDNNLIILKDDGTCDYSASFDNSIYFDVTRWTDIIDVTCGDDFFAGLKANGTIEVASLNLNNDLIKTWENIIAIDAGKKFIIAYDGSNIFGDGINNYHLFNSSNVNKQILSSIQNVSIVNDVENIIINFDPVENASSYEITLVLNDGYEINKIVDTNVNVVFSAISLKDGETYNVNIKALGSGIYADSATNNVSFIYSKNKNIEEDDTEKIKISVNLVGSSRKDFESYLIKLGIDNFEAYESENYCEDNIEKVDKINGITPGSTYFVSELKSKDISYSYCKINIEEESLEENVEENLEN